MRGIVLFGLLVRGAAAQSHYRNLDAGRPLRIEDAEPEALYALDVDAAPFQIERLDGGTMRYRAEPKLGYGVLPLTELELRAPIMQVSPPGASASRATAGLAGVSVGVMRELTLESPWVPAIAVSAELALPVGNLAPRQGSYFLKGLVTRTTSLGRFHLNAGAGTYAVRPPASTSSACATNSGFRFPGDTSCASLPPLIFDTPCSVAPGGGAIAGNATRFCMAPPPRDTTPAAPRTRGEHWLAGAAFDHSLALSSTLVAADLFAERFVGLYPQTDWTAELGVRHELTPRLVVHAGAGRHFAGVVRSSFVTMGAALNVALPPW